MNTTIEIPSKLEKGDELYLVFNLTRGKPRTILRAKTVGVDVVLESPTQEFSLPSNVLRLRFTRIPRSKKLTVETAIEAVEIVKTIHHDRSKKKFLVHTMAEEDGRPRLVAEHPDRTEFLREEILDPLAFDQEVALALEDLHAFRSYFWELDRQSHPDLIPLQIPSMIERETRIGAINRAMDLLRQRLIERGQRRKKGQPLSPLAPLLRPDDVPYWVTLSDLQLTIIRKHFALDSPEGLQRFERAYEMFANGELGLYLPKSGAWACEPSSGYYFLFAEFALLAADPSAPLAPALGPERRTWERLCNVLVRTQEVFCRVYAPAKDAKRDFAAYTATNYWNQRKPLGSTDKEALRQRFANATLDTLKKTAADNVIQYLPGVLV